MTSAARKAALRVVRAKGLVWLGIEQTHWQQGVASLAGRRFTIELGARWAAHRGDDSNDNDNNNDDPDTKAAAAAAAASLWQEPWGYRRTELVVIGQDMDHDDMRAALEACLLSDEEMALYADKFRDAEPGSSSSAARRDEGHAKARAAAHAAARSRSRRAPPSVGHAALLSLVNLGDADELVRLLKTDAARDAIDAQGANGLTALHVACLNGRADIAKVLVNAGASLDIVSDPVGPGKTGKTALEVARDLGHADVAQVIVLARDVAGLMQMGLPTL